jgi:hypothetical protein
VNRRRKLIAGSAADALDEEADVLGCIFLFSGIYFLGPKTVPDRIPEDFFFSCVFWKNFHRNVVLERSQEIRFFLILQEFFTGIPVGSNSYLLRNPPESFQFRRIPVPAKSFVADRPSSN